MEIRVEVELLEIGSVLFRERVARRYRDLVGVFRGLGLAEAISLRRVRRGIGGALCRLGEIRLPGRVLDRVARLVRTEAHARRLAAIVV